MDVPLMSKVLVFVLFIAGKIPLREEVRHPIIPHEKKKDLRFFFPFTLFYQIIFKLAISSKRNRCKP